MERKKKILSLLLLGLFCATQVTAQQTIPATGGNGTGSGGTVSFTVGQITYETLPGTNGTVAQGVQQPYEISVVTAIENTTGIILEYSLYPNPTRDLIKLAVEPFSYEKMRFRVYDINGALLQDRKIESDETEISLESYPSAVYFLNVIRNNIEVKVFKIIRR